MSRQDDLLKSLETLRRSALEEDSPLRAIKHLPAQEGKYADYPPETHPDLVKALREKGIERLYTHQRAIGPSGRPARTWSSSRPPPRARRSATTSPSSTPSSRTPGPRPLPLPDQGPGPGPAGRARRDIKPCPRRSASHLRRRHAPGRPQGHPRPRPRHPDQPRHAPRRASSRTTPSGSSSSRI